MLTLNHQKGPSRKQIVSGRTHNIFNLSAVPPDLLHIMQPLLGLKTFRLSLGHGSPTDNATLLILLPIKSAIKIIKLCLVRSSKVLFT